jgi:hypothetical protein
LREAGFPKGDLRLVLVRNRAIRQDHAVLAARHDDGWLILDNRRTELMTDSEASSYTPLFAINHRGVQLFAAPFAKRPQLEAEAAAGDGEVGVGFGWVQRQPISTEHAATVEHIDTTRPSMPSKAISRS